MCARLLSCALPVFIFLLLPAEGHCLPWDFDLAKQQSLKVNEIARSPAEGSVPKGYKPFTLTVEEAERNLKNPVDFSLSSVWRGKRVWSSNCLTCHGASGAGEGPVGSLVGAPNLLDEFYRLKTDGRVFAVLHYGQGAMPRYGYKFTERQEWDVINYLRFLQGKDIHALERPPTLTVK